MRAKPISIIIVILICALTATNSAAQSPPRIESIAVESSFGRWFQRLRVLYPDLGNSSFSAASESRFRLRPNTALKFDTYESLHEGTGDILRATIERSPRKGFGASTFVYNLVKTGEYWTLASDSDSYLYLFDMESLEGWPVLSLGNSGRVDAVGWIDDQTCVALGVLADDISEKRHLYLWEFDISYGLVEWYQGPEVNDEQLRRLSALWWGWLVEQYSSVKWRRIP